MLCKLLKIISVSLLISVACHSQQHTINYQIPELSNVTLKVYDVLGNEVAQLVNEEKPVGSYEVEFEGEELSSGIYLYKLQAGSFVETKKMVLTK